MLTQSKYGFESSGEKSLFVKIVELISALHIEYTCRLYLNFDLLVPVRIKR